MFEYFKLLLVKLSFSKKLFLKEYKKSFRYLDPVEQVAFKRWVREHFRGT